MLHGHITAVKWLSFCSSGLALVSGGIGGLLNIWSLQVRKLHSRFASFEVNAKTFPDTQTMVVYYLNPLNFNSSGSLCILQDGSVLQTATGLGSVVSTTWIPNLGVAACFGRSKVS